MKTKREVIEALDKIVTVLSGEDITGPCTARKKDKRGGEARSDRAGQAWHGRVRFGGVWSGGVRLVG